MVEQAFVLVGGLGTRLRSAVPDLPKPMAPVAGRPFLEHLLDYFLSQSVKQIVMCLGYGGQIIEDYFGSSYRGVAIRYSVEARPLGTGGALSQALGSFRPESPFLVANGDTFFPIDTESLFEKLGANSWAVASFRTKDSRRFGVLEIGPSDELLGFRSGRVESERESAESFAANSGIWIGNPAQISVPLLDDRLQFSLEEYLSWAIVAQRATATHRPFDSLFIDIGVPKDFALAQTVLESFRA